MDGLAEKTTATEGMFRASTPRTADSLMGTVSSLVFLAGH